MYLSKGERAELDRARELGISRAEALRRGLRALGEGHSTSFYDAFEQLIGSIDSPAAPADLAERHDEYLARDLVARKVRSPRGSS
ncbi:MAG: hypothetical protein KatS3mg081_2601 [Gemmatimonadales bacterium]|nr:MAG: hypothetical protein KatS3mg081_2601 [Gemmatimonadales bacterium]